MECASGLAEEDAKEGSMHGLYRPGRIAMRTAMAAAGYKAIGTVAKKAGMKQATLYKRVRIPTTALVSELRAIDAVAPSTPEQDTHLKDELCEQSSMSGIFMWLVRGYIKYKEHGLEMSGTLKEVVNNYERENDIVLQFLENRCVTDATATIKAKDLYQNFKMWAKSEGAYVLSARKFNSEMERHPELPV